MRSCRKRQFIFLLLVPLWGGFLFFSPFSCRDARAAQENEVEFEHPPARNGKAFLEIKAGKTEAYLQEKIPLSITLYVKESRVKDIRYPQLNNEDLAMEEFPQPLHQSGFVNGILYDTFEFQTNFFATRPGNFSLGPAELTFMILEPKKADGSREDFFGSSEARPFFLKSGTIPIHILPLPEKGKPKDFNQAVGDFSLHVEVDRQESGVREPLSLKMIIEGQGNFETITPPGVSGSIRFKIYPPQRKKTGKGVIFEQILLPQSPSVQEIPPVHFGFFNPGKGVYQVLKGGPIPIRIRQPGQGENLTSGPSPQAISGLKGKGPLGSDIIDIKDHPGPLKPKGVYLYHNKIYWGAQALLLLSAMLIKIFLNQRDKIRNDLRYAGQRRATQEAKKGVREIERILRKGKEGEFYDRLGKFLHGYLKHKFLILPGELTSGEVEETLSAQGVDIILRAKVKEILDECSLALYGAFAFDRGKKEETFRALKEIIGHLEKRKS